MPARPSEDSDSFELLPPDHYAHEEEEHTSLLPRSAAPQSPAMTTHHSAIGRFRAYWLATVICMSGFLQGYDSGIVGGVLTLESFSRDYGFVTGTTRVNSLTVSLQNAGAFVACFAVWPVTNKLGRRKAMLISSVIFILGAIIETINTHSLTAFYIGRVVAGFGLGASTVIVPMFCSEMAPKEIRGQVGCFFQLFFTFGIFTSYWTDYGVSQGVASTSMQWQIPIGLQIVPAGLMGIGTFTLKESVRWYTVKGMHDKAWDSLKWIRGSDGPEVQAEMEEIRTGVKLENQDRAGFKFAELLERQNFKLLSAAFIIYMAQQATGATAFAYFGPQYFGTLAGDNPTRNLLLTGIFGAVKIVACLTFVIFLSERFERRTSFVWGAGLMAAIFYTTAAVNKSFPPAGGSNPPISAAGKATVALIYLFVMVYNGSWGPLPWPYVSEIFPTRIREPGIATGVASQWLFNFVFSLTTPYMITNLGWGTFLLWGVFNTVICIGSFIFFKHTRGLSLEEINSRMMHQNELFHAKLQEAEEESDPGVDQKSDVDHKSDVDQKAWETGNGELVRRVA